MAHQSYNLIDTFNDSKVVAFDTDHSAKKHASPIENIFADRFLFIRSRFSGCTAFKEQIMEFTGGNYFDCVVMDLGLCSAQVCISSFCRYSYLMV